jgi:hypothetical protein
MVIKEQKSLTMDAAILAVLKEAPDTGMCLYAKAYAKASAEAAVTYGTEGLKTQVLYILSNLGSWKGERAREVKAVLKAYTKKP